MGAPVYEAAAIRNIALVGHNAAGKTSLGEAILFKSGVTTRLGSIPDKTSFLDFDDESKSRGHSTESTAFYVERDGRLLNFVDTPGTPDYCGLAIAALAAVETAVITISAAGGIGVNARRMFKIAGDYGLARMVVITHIDHAGVDLEAQLAAVREFFGKECHPVNLPCDGGKGVIDVLARADGKSDILDVAHCHTELIDSIVETDESLMEEYMSSGTVALDRLKPAIARAVQSGHVVPVFFVNAVQDVGVENFLAETGLFAPSPLDGKKRVQIIGEGETRVERPIAPDPDGPFIAQCYKVTSDPKSHIRYSLCRVLSGKLTSSDQLFIGDDRRGQRPGHLLRLQGGEHTEVDAASAGDLVAFAKLEIHIGDVVRSKADEGRVPMPAFPKPMFGLAIEPKSRGDADKIAGALARFRDEDPCFSYDRDPETGELVMHGLGDQHLIVVREKIKRLYKVEMEVHPPKVPYHETIAGKASDVEYTHKKQSGGAGQYAKVVISLEPTGRGEGYEFKDKIFGGAIDLQFRPSVDKGIREVLKKGVLAGFPVVDCRVTLVDGKTHPVDSKDIAFQVAGRNAFRQAFMKAKPILLEPIVHIEITVPADYVGDISRDLSGKRGQVVGQDQLPGNQMVIKALVPLAEVSNYSSQLKSATAGQGSYVMDLSHYDVVPPNVQQQIVAQHQPKHEED